MLAKTIRHPLWMKTWQKPETAEEVSDKQGIIYASINVNPVGEGGSAGKGRGFDARDYPLCWAFDRVKRPRGRDIGPTEA